MKIIREKSYAKINLFLKILGKNAQGYHFINSLMAFINIYDVITVKKSNELKLKIIGDKANILQNNNRENILIKVINLFYKEFNIDTNLEILLEKNIPIAAGLGGGSANAATLIYILINLFNLKISQKKLYELALQIGSDVPFCLYRKIALISSIGEKITNFKCEEKELFLLIINPNIQLSTKEIFSLYASNHVLNVTKYKADYLLKDKSIQPYNLQDLISIIKNNDNDLKKSAIKFCPEISQILENLKLQKNIITAKLSGSGATCFGIFDNELDLDIAYKNMKFLFASFYVKKSKLLYNI